jgi:hypothetical protein
VKLAYFVHDLTDPAVARRVRMLWAGGADPIVLGFRRSEAAPARIEGAPAIDLGRTYDARFGHRALAAAGAALASRRWRRRLEGVEALMARNLEMLAVAQAARRSCGLAGRLVYECLDIHRLMLDPGAKGRALRSLERGLMARCDLLVVSSPAFLSCYFEPVQGLGPDRPLASLLVENKVLELEAAPPAERLVPPGPPWRIGWLGAIRCRRSLAILTDLAARRPDLLEVRIHGRPAHGEFDDFDGRVAAAANVSFGGPYLAADLPRLYGEVHFAWAIDYMEAGLNSAWLLPNRLYEASRFGAPPIALASVETGRALARLGVGLAIDDPRDLEPFLESLTPERYAGLQRALARAPRKAFVADRNDCRALVEAIGARRLKAAAESARLVA